MRTVPTRTLADNMATRPFRQQDLQSEVIDSGTAGGRCDRRYLVTKPQFGLHTVWSAEDRIPDGRSTDNQPASWSHESGRSTGTS